METCGSQIKHEYVQWHGARLQPPGQGGVCAHLFFLVHCVFSCLSLGVVEKRWEGEVTGESRLIFNGLAQLFLLKIDFFFNLKSLIFFL